MILTANPQLSAFYNPPVDAPGISLTRVDSGASFRLQMWGADSRELDSIVVFSEGTHANPTD